MRELCSTALEMDIETAYVRELIQRRSLVPDFSKVVSPLWPFPVKISTFGQFGLFINENPLQSLGKTQKKPLELLKAIIAFGGKEVDECALADAVWPDAKAEPKSVLKINVHRLRKILVQENAIVHQEGTVSLDPRLCWIDLWTFNQLISEANSILNQPHQSRNGEGTAAALDRIDDQILSLYRGHFLEQEKNLIWTITPREILRKVFLNYLLRAGKYWEEARLWEKAIDAYNRGLNIDSMAEPLYQSLMTCYLKLNRRAEALATYQHCHNLFQGVLRIPPSPETEAVYRQLFK